jgi:CRP-like cAMP-binding protein
VIETEAMKKPEPIACAVCAHHGTALAEGLSPDHVRSFERDKTVQVVLEGQTLFCEGGVAHSVHCVRSGSFKLLKLDRDAT